MMGFQEAVERTPSLTEAYYPGLQALGGQDSDRISCSQPHRLTGSVNLEEALRPLKPNDPIWDYGVGFTVTNTQEIAYWIEVHPASSTHVNDVFNKLHWLKTWLINEAPALGAFQKKFVWIASGQVNMPSGSPQRKRIAANGIEFVGQRFTIP